MSEPFEPINLWKWESIPKFTLLARFSLFWTGLLLLGKGFSVGDWGLIWCRRQRLSQSATVSSQKWAVVGFPFSQLFLMPSQASNLRQALVRSKLKQGFQNRGNRYFHNHAHIGHDVIGDGDGPKKKKLYSQGFQSETPEPPPMTRAPQKHQHTEAQVMTREIPINDRSQSFRKVWWITWRSTVGKIRTSIPILPARVTRRSISTTTSTLTTMTTTTS